MWGREQACVGARRMLINGIMGQKRVIKSTKMDFYTEFAAELDIFDSAFRHSGMDFRLSGAVDSQNYLESEENPSVAQRPRPEFQNLLACRDRRQVEIRRCVFPETAHGYNRHQSDARLSPVFHAVGACGVLSAGLQGAGGGRCGRAATEDEV